MLLLLVWMGQYHVTSAQVSFTISGQWNGTVQVPVGSYLLAEYHFDQEGLILKGYVRLKTTNGKDSSEHKFQGAIKGGEVHFRGTEQVYNTGWSCLSVTTLNYSVVDGQEMLTGKWKGDLSLKTCPPGTSGKVEIARVKAQKPEDKPVETASAIHHDDQEGNALAQELKRRKYYALIIGIDKYSDESILDLDNPVADARALKQVLRTYYTFEEENVTLLQNPTRSEIIESFDALNSKVSERDHLLVFYAGHGIWDERLNQGFWLPADASMHSKAQWLSNSTIRDYIRGIQSKHTLLITDACFSGSIFKERGATFADGRAMLEMYKLPSRKAMTSGALKTVPDKSVFVKYLTKNLADNSQPLLSAEDLFRTFKIAVINNSSNGQVPQYGPIREAGDEGGDFIFLRR